MLACCKHCRECSIFLLLHKKCFIRGNQPCVNSWNIAKRLNAIMGLTPRLIELNQILALNDFNPVFLIIINTIWASSCEILSMISNTTFMNSILTPWHHEEKPHNIHKTPGRQNTQGNQLSLHHQDD